MLGMLFTFAACSTSKEEENLRVPSILYEKTIGAHRGNESAPENTMVSFQKAFDLGLRYFECDVQFTSDNVPVLLHDTTIDRTSNGSGEISSFTYEELKQYDFGSWKSDEYAGEAIPSLEEFLSFCKENDCIAELDLANRNYTLEQKTILYTMVEKMEMIYDTVFCATDDELTDYMNMSDGHIIVSISGILSIEIAKEVLPKYENVYLAIPSVPYIDSDGVEHLTQELSDYIHSLGMKCKTFTVNSTLDLDKALNLGADIILSDSILKIES